MLTGSYIATADTDTVLRINGGLENRRASKVSQSGRNPKQLETVIAMQTSRCSAVPGMSAGLKGDHKLLGQLSLDLSPSRFLFPSHRIVDPCLVWYEVYLVLRTEHIDIHRARWP
jgi:hypothetical protein